jgi:hypothetical protein
VITIDSLVIGDEPEAWRAAGFTVEGAVTRLGEVKVELVGRTDGRGIRSWKLRGAGEGPFDGDIDGLVTRRLDGAPERGDPADHANGTVLIDHVVVATPRYEHTIGALGDAGFELRRERDTGSYGSPMRQGFFRAGEVIIEVIGPGEPSGDGPAGFFGIALTVADLDATAALLGDALGTAKDAVQPGRRIATLRHRDLHLSTAIAFMSAEPA